MLHCGLSLQVNEVTQLLLVERKLVSQRDARVAVAALLT
jgi:hypothetical protein